MKYTVQVKPGHPTGVRRRSGMEFTSAPIGVAKNKMTPEILDDPWLVVVDTMADDQESEEEKAKAKAKAEAEAKAKAKADAKAKEAANGNPS